MTTDQNSHQELLSLTTEIVSAHLSNNQVPPDEIPALIQKVYKTLSNVTADGGTAATERPQPAVPIKRSITPDYIVCLEDGKRLKTLKRHLRHRFGMTPEAYRAKWKLPSDYPMTAPNYAARRSSLAKSFGLGQRNRKATARKTRTRK